MDKFRNEFKNILRDFETKWNVGREDPDQNVSDPPHWSKSSSKWYIVNRLGTPQALHLVFEGLYHALVETIS